MKEVLSKTWKACFTGKFKSFFWGSVGSVASVLLAARNFLGFPVLTSVAWGVGSVVCLIVLRLLCFVCVYSFKHYYMLSRERVYGNMIIAIGEMVGSMNQLRRQEVIPDDKLKTNLANICQQLKLVFEKKRKGLLYSVSIKLVTGAGDSADTLVKNLCRDKEAGIRDTEKYIRTPHKIFMNTCYNHILTQLTNNKKATHYVNNDITLSKGYENTSRICYDKEEFPYKSELVVPILPKFREEQLALLGFLCIDCREPNAFDEKYDVAIAESIAEGIFDLICQHAMQATEAAVREAMNLQVPKTTK